jgi:radical SAM superfamily enzyme YgiQ (UPF0313 family)
MTFPPLLTNSTHPEIGMPELTGNLRARGIAVVQRDLNIELMYDELVRGERLAELARWICERAPGSGNDPMDARTWSDRMIAAAGRSGTGPRTASLHELLERERFRTNRTSQADTSWMASHPPVLEPPALAGWPARLAEQASGFVDLCASLDGFWQTVIDWLQYFVFAPRTFALSDVLKAASSEPPLLPRFLAGRVEAMAVDAPPPDVFGVSLHAQDQLVPALVLLHEVKRRWPSAMLVAGGPWCTAAAEVLERADPLFDHLDVVVLGKGLEPVLALVERGRGTRSVVGIPGTVARRGTRLELSPPNLGLALADLALPDFDGLPLRLYPHARLPVRLHDGCPWGRCLFCYHFFPGAHRAGEPPIAGEHLHRVVSHVADLRRRSGVRWFSLIDHAVPFATLRGFARRVLDAGLDIEWDAMSRFEPGLSADGCRILRDSGCRDVFLGLETVDPEGLRFLGKGISIGDIERGVSACADAGLRIRVFLIAYPGQGLEALQRTIDWVLDRFPAVSDVMLSRFTLARGTRSWENREALRVLPTGLDGEPDLDVFQVPYDAPHTLALARFGRIWTETRDRFQEARTRADLSALDARSDTQPSHAEPRRRTRRRRTRVTLLGTGLDADHARGESRRYNLATAALHAALRAHPVVGDRINVRHLSVPFDLDSPELDDGVLTTVLETEPDILGLSCYAWDLEAQLSLAARVKRTRPDVRVVVGGPSATFHTRALLAANPAVDAAVRGEGEETLAALLGASWDDFSGLRSVAWRDPDGAVHEEPMGPPVADLSTLRSPLLDGLLEPPRDNLLLEFSRGCVARCRHCAWQTHGRGVRRVPRERVRAEIAWARDHGYRHGFIIDSSINSDDRWLAVLTDAVVEADPGGALALSYFIDFRFVTPAQARALSRLRTHEVLVGLESVNPEALRTTGRRAAVREPFTRAVDLLAEAVGPVTPNIMFGMPGDDIDGFSRTLDFIAELAERPGPRRIRQARVHWTIVAPGSHFSEHASKFGLRVHPRGIPYVLGSETFPDLLHGLRLIRDHPRADLFIWEDAEPVRILGGEAPDMLSPGGGRVGGPAPVRISDEAMLRAIAPLEPGRTIRAWRVAPLERHHGQPEVVLIGPEDRTVRLRFRPRDTDPNPRARTRSFDLSLDRDHAARDERQIVEAMVRLVRKNDP